MERQGIEINLPTSSSSLVHYPDTQPMQAEEGKKRQYNRYSEAYNEWSKSQDEYTLRKTLARLYQILNITGNSEELRKQQSKWARRFRMKASEEIKEDIESDDVTRHQRAFYHLAIRQKTKLGEFGIGERRIVADRLNRYWKIDKQAAYCRFIKQAMKKPHLVALARSSNEVDILTAAEEMTPRPYNLQQNPRRPPKKKKDSFLEDLNMTTQIQISVHPNSPTATSPVATSSLNEDGANPEENFYKAPTFDP